MAIMTIDTALVLTILLAAVLYSSVGHGGASGYLAAMALFGVDPAMMKPAALVLNTLVSAIGTIRFAMSGGIRHRLLWPFAATSIPCAFIGGSIDLPGRPYRWLIAAILLASAVRLLWQRKPAPGGPTSPPLSASLGGGVLIGLLAGLSGTGGGIFLSPLLLLMNWSTPREAVGVSAAFILLNSVAGIAARPASIGQLPPDIVYWVFAVIAGGLIGSELAARRLSAYGLQRVLAIVLIAAAAKFVLS